MNRRVHTLAALVAFAGAAIALAAPTLNVGSKRFTESYILGEILKQTAQSAGETNATHSQGLGNTAIVLNALTTGSIDVYPEYTGTIAKEILKLDSVRRCPSSTRSWRRWGWRSPFLWASTTPTRWRCAATTRVRATSRGCPTSKRIPTLRLGLSQEFIGRADGWPGLKRTYELPFETPRGLDHGLALRSHRAAPGRCDRHLLDRRQARQVRPDGARRRPHVLPALRRGAAVPRGSPAAPAQDVGGAREAARHDRRRGDAPDERGRRARQQGLCHRCRGLPEPASSQCGGVQREGRQLRRFLAQALRARFLAPDARAAWTRFSFAGGQHRHRHPARDSRREASGDGRLDHRRDRRRADDSLARAPRRPDPADRAHRRSARVHRTRACTRCCRSCAIRMRRLRRFRAE